MTGNAVAVVAAGLTMSLGTSAYADVLAGWDVSTRTTSNNSASPFAAGTSGANVTVGSLTLGSGLNAQGSGVAATWGASSFASSTQALAITNNDFITFSLTTAANYSLSLSSISPFWVGRSGNGANNGALQYSLNGSSYTDVVNNLSYTTATANQAVTLSSVTALQNIAAGTTVTFRIVNWATGTPTGNGNWYIADGVSGVGNDFVVNGTTANTVGGNFYFDLTNTAGSGVAANGAYTFSGNTFNAAADGIGTPGAFTNGQTATFSAGADAAGLNYSVAVDTAIVSNGLTFEEGNITLTAGTGSLTLAGATVSVAVGTSTIEQGMTGSVGLTKTGTGKLTLSGSNAYTGTTTVSAGTLQIGNAGTIGSVAGDITNNAALVFNRMNTATYPGVISGTGTLEQAGAGTLVLTGSNTYSGNTAVSAGTLQVGDGGTTGAIASNVTNNAALVFNRSNAYTYAGVVSGNGSVTHAGNGVLTLSGTSTYAGATVVSAGTLNLTGSLTGTNGVTLSNGAALASGVNSSIKNTVSAGSGSVVSPGGTGVSTLTLGGLTLASGAGLAFDLSGATTDKIVLSAATGTGILALETGAQSLTLAGTPAAGSYDLLTYTSLANANNAFTLNSSGLTNLFSYALATNAAKTTLTITPNVFSFFDANGTAAGSGVTGSGTYGTATTGLFNTLADGTGPTNALSAGQVATFSAGTDAAGLSYAVTVNSTLTVGGLAFEDGNVTLAAGSGALNLGGNEVNVAANASATITQNITSTSTAGLTKTGDGTLTLSPSVTNAYTGATLVNAGTLAVTNARGLGAAAGGTTVASGAALEISGGVSIAETNIGATGTGIGNGGAIRNVSGDNAIAGTLTLNGPTRVTAVTGTLTTSNAVGGTNTALTVGGAGNVTASGGVSIGNGVLTKDGNGTLTLGASSTAGGLSMQAGSVALNAANTFTSGVGITGGTVTLGNDNGLGPAAAVSMTGGSLSLNGRSPTLSSLSGSAGAVRNDSPSTASTLTFSPATGTDPAFSGTVSNGGAAALAIVKNGLGEQALGGSNTFSGGTTINAGILRAAHDSALGGGTVTMTGGSLVVANTKAVANAIVIGSPATTSSITGNLTAWDFAGLAGGGPTTYAGTNATGITNAGLVKETGFRGTAGAGNAWGAGASTVAANSAAAITAGQYAYFTVSSDTGTFSLSSIPAYNVRRTTGGPTTGLWQYRLNAGTWADIGSAITWGTVIDGTGNAAAAIPLSGIGALQGVTPGTSVSLRVLLYGNSMTSTSGTWYLNDPNGSAGTDFAVAGTVTTNVAASGSGTIGIDTPGSAAFNGPITVHTTGTLTAASGGTATFANGISGSGGIVKTGAGKVVLDGINTFSGGTTISAGTLVASSSNSTGASAVTVEANGTLAGDDTVAGPVAVNGTITGGLDAASIGTLTVGAGTAFKSGGKAVVNYASIGNTMDLINVAGTLALQANSGSPFMLSLVKTDATSLSPGLYTFAHATAITGFDAGAFVLSIDGLSISSADYTVAVTSGIGGGGGFDLNLQYSPAPEPTIVTLVTLAAAPLLGRRRRMTAA